MLNLFSRMTGKSPEEKTSVGSETVAIATAVFLLEIVHADSKVHVLEEGAVRDGLETIFGKSGCEIDSVLQSARQARDEAFDLYRFSKEINRHFKIDEKILVLETIWRVIYADGDLDKYEEALIRKIAKLMRLSHREMISAKLKVLAENENSLPRDDDKQI